MSAKRSYTQISKENGEHDILPLENENKRAKLGEEKAPAEHTVKIEISERDLVAAATHSRPVGPLSIEIGGEEFLVRVQVSRVVDEVKDILADMGDDEGVFREMGGEEEEELLLEEEEIEREGSVVEEGVLEEDLVVVVLEDDEDAEAKEDLILFDLL